MRIPNQTLRAALSVSAALTVALATSDARSDDLQFKVVGETSGYKDSDAVNVLTNALHAEVNGVTTGWGVGATLLVDVVTAASTDIVATASPKWTDYRYAPGLTGHFKIDDTTLSLSGDASIESDYYAGSGSVGVSVDLAKKTITPAFTYAFGYDVAGRAETPLSVYSLTSQTHTFGAAVAFVVNQSTIIVPAFRAILELGDMEKPYRYLPTFLPRDADIAADSSRRQVDAKRTGIRLAENVPDVRHRYALSALLAHRFGHTTVRVEQRLYVDSWSLLATTTDTTIPFDIGEQFRIWPHLRFHAQTGVSFWEHAYTVEPSGQGYLVPALRVGDPELGPLLTGTFGMGFRFGTRVGFTASADALYTVFLDHLYERTKLGGLGTLVFDAEVD